LIFGVVFAALIVACERAENDQTSELPPPTEFRIATLETLAPLWPNTPTYLALDRRRSTIYYSQPTKEGRDVVMQFGARGFSETTALTAAAVASEMGRAGVPGNFIALAGGGDGNIYFLFKGLGGKEPVFAFGQYQPATARVRVLADADVLMRDSRLGASIDLASAAIVATERYVYLLLSVLEEPLLLRIEPARLPSSGMVTLARPFERATSGSEVLRLGSSKSRLSAGAGDTLLFIDTHAAGIFAIEPDGKARELGTLIALPERVSPLVPLAGDRVAFFVSEGEEIRGSVESRLDAAKVQTSYPAILIYSRDKTIGAIPKERLTVRQGLPVYALRVTETLGESEESFIAYDAASGELMRVRVGE
jgi:hypothetical protein